jgi:hypothetical protein
MQKTCNVAEMAFLAKKIGGKSKKLAEIYPPYPPLFACMGMLALFMKKKDENSHNPKVIGAEMVTKNR